MSARPLIIGASIWALGVGAVFYVATFGQLVLNGTQSLPHTAYFMVTWPKTIAHGSYVTFAPPAALRDAFDGTKFVKRVHGLPGDVIEKEELAVCVRGNCRALKASVVARGYGAIASDVVPEHHVLVFGDSQDSLDSRYDIVGTIPQAAIEAVGWPVRFPHWKEIAAWLG